MTKKGICRARFAWLRVFFASVMAVVIGNGTAPAESNRDPAAVAITIDAENLIELYQSVPGLRIIDSRLREDYAQGHIETSQNLPLSETDCDRLQRLAGKRDQALVFYSNGNAGSTSLDAIRIAYSCGYERLFWLRGGFVEWEDKDYPYVIE